jgi:hypothetical protein
VSMLVRKGRCALLCKRRSPHLALTCISLRILAPNGSLTGDVFTIIYITLLTRDDRFQRVILCFLALEDSFNRSANSFAATYRSDAMRKGPFDVNHDFLRVLRVLFEVVSQEVCRVRFCRAVMDTTVP